MSKDPHFTALENMYLAAPINEFYREEHVDFIATTVKEVARELQR